MLEENTATVMKESKLDLNEMFFSITKHDSTIESGNDVFVHISGYEKEELIGQYHNIIRDPDMPKVIFKVFWDYLNAKKPIVAYVKNRTKEGGFYWVLSIVFPLDEHYVSIRIKPNTEIFATVRELYFRLLMSEAKHNMEATEELLYQLLNELGYEDYDQFMNEVLLSELLLRKKLQTQQEGASYKRDILAQEKSLQNEVIANLFEISTQLSQRYTIWFEKIELFTKMKCDFEAKGQGLLVLARDIVFLSLNASVSSYKMEQNGETFGVLASDIRTNAKENDILIEKIHTEVEILTEAINEVIFMASYVSLQIEMVTYFIQELLEKNDPSLYENIDTLFELVGIYNDKLMQQPKIIDKTVREIAVCLDELEQQVMYLGYIQVYGFIESARCLENGLGFTEIFSQLKTLIATTSDEILMMKNMADNFVKENNRLVEQSGTIYKMLDNFEQETKKLS
ncbi:PAS domain-containing protein [Sulfurimonas microaerophilic]|uniref:PAS domain-containing protein n=1 Tax=Sulfurimonas microaerophilic TaxID=3058392 RepID=UPI0027146583|nr:PAS domain-containing protein [Sulfurimonas sp. hsl 1-7]